MPPATIARILHLALMSSVVLATLVMSVIPIPGSSLAPLFLYAVFGVAAVLFAGALVISTRLPRTPSQGKDDWWTQNLPRAIVIWAMLEGPSLLGSIAFLLSRDYTALVVPITGLVLFVVLGPARLEQG
jgi:hypothetical protein